MNYDINEFKKIWKDSDKESILNQFYNEHKELYEVYEVIKEVREYIEHENFKRNVLVGVSTKKYTKDILNNVLEILDKVSDK